MTTHNQAALPAIGTPLEGGFYAGLLNINGETFGLIVAPKAAGELPATRWGDYPQDVTGACSYSDGLANTQAMVEAGSELAAKFIELEIGGFSGWYLPSRDELELLYRNFKPTTAQNYCSFRDGENPSSVPVAYPYTEHSPAQTTSSAFQEGGEEAFAARWYWASTQYSPSYAWIQGFDDGYQYDGHKGNEYPARAVRRFKVTP